jgi:hypothetical protein
MCNMGPDGWKPGRIVALHYREDHWPEGTIAPYQVALEEDHALIYVPEDDAAYCREVTREDLRIASRPDALAALPPHLRGIESVPPSMGTRTAAGLHCPPDGPRPCSQTYRSGGCHCCDSCPRSWSSVELYSEHYRCAERNGLAVAHHVVDLGTVRVGHSLRHPAADALPRQGFLQCPTLVRLPPGIRFEDDGALAGEVRFDPHRGAVYGVEFVAVSTAHWDDPAIGIVRLEIRFVVEGNEPALTGQFDEGAFVREQQQARTAANQSLMALGDAWDDWERDEVGIRDTCDRMCAELRRLRALLEQHPRLDAGRWWAQLGGYHMNVHKLLENTLFECELYLGHALTFGDPEVRRMAERNLEGCYQKRLLEAARFMWIDGVEQMQRGEWQSAAETLRLAATKKDGWGWAVNNGDIWLAEATARLAHGAERAAEGRMHESPRWLLEVEALLERSGNRVKEGGMFGPEGHPWAADIAAALRAYRGLTSHRGAEANAWLQAFTSRTHYWCAQVLGGASPFPPRPRPRLEDAATLVRRLPSYGD